MLSQVEHSCTFHSALREELVKNIYIRIKEVMNVTWVLDVRDGIYFGKMMVRHAC